MFTQLEYYRRKRYVVKGEFVEILNNHFNNTNLPNQLKYGSRLVGRWMKANNDDTVEIFAIWEYDSYEDYMEIEKKIQSDQAHIKRIQYFYEEHGGREFVYKEYIIDVKNEALESTVKR
ncbi:NIPSNAP family protein [Bacillus carboniphilus]|uniref:NIPSNAP family protein n=1 Tax=Bacillus carboniphilus TaxID=86663 RepID=A0ABY9K004_9BACI|nr:NIPSNAP family protein [Bacillus carboniphilus]WLR44363.1 NIPSNAP family protein [Bacillus carboniphilus]